MSDWTEEVAAAEAHAQRLQTVEEAAEERFYTLKASVADRDEAVKSPEFSDWMAARRATDEAWGAWSQVMDAKPQQ